MSVSEDAVLEKLKNVIDPELFVNIVDLGLIYEIKLNQGGEDSTASAEETSAAESSTEETSGNEGGPEANKETQGESAPAAPAGAAAAVNTEPASSETAPAGEGVNVHIDMTMTSPACPAGPQLIEGARREVGSLESVQQVEVRIVLDPPWTPDRMTEDAKDQLGIF
ncbi:MAG: metal-sulfur cluster assembly factor [Planctomycetota bacterium]|nr:metal-sulfur cluster assembly factor [Planctomycetota bacterium]